MAVYITVDDVRPFVLNGSEDVIQSLIEGTIARAAILAPCLVSGDLAAGVAAAAKDILVQVIARAVETGTGQITSISAGGFSQSVDSNPRSKARFRPDEIRELQALCGMKKGGAFTISLSYEDSEAGTLPSPVRWDTDV